MRALLAADVSLSRLDAFVAEEVLDLLDLIAIPDKPHWQQPVVTTDQITFGLNPFGATRRTTAENSGTSSC